MIYLTLLKDGLSFQRHVPTISGVGSPKPAAPDTEQLGGCGDGCTQLAQLRAIGGMP